MPTGWTGERQEILVTLAAQGKRSREIADAIGDGMTRCAVIGRARRTFVKLIVPSGNAGHGKPPRIRIRKPLSVARRSQRTSGLRLLVDATNSLSATFEGMDFAKQCVFPTTDDAPFLYCGHPKVAGSYCAYHKQLCYSSPQSPTWSVEQLKKQVHRSSFACEAA